MVHHCFQVAYGTREGGVDVGRGHTQLPLHLVVAHLFQVFHLHGLALHLGQPLHHAVELFCSFLDEGRFGDDGLVAV